MYINSFNGRELYTMLVGSANMLATRKGEIDALNVFPVPDGDTGTNMYYTLLEGVHAAEKRLGENIDVVAAAAAEGCLLGARGNSGVILSQIVAGFAEVLAGKERATLKDVYRAFGRGLEKAKVAIANPVPGTIITVCEEIVEAFGDASGRSYDLVRATVLAYKRALKALDKTPELLPVLKEAGVVDAGGKGLVVILEGFIKALKDAALSRDVELFDVAAEQQRQFASTGKVPFSGELEFTYCTEFILTGNHIPMDTLRKELKPYGDCLMVVGNDKMTKVHIHSNHPGLVLECGLRYGNLKEIHINNMEEQMEEHNSQIVATATANSTPEVKPIGVVAVVLGEGISIIMSSLGVDRVVQGGQTMNPSAQDLLAAINEINAEKVIVLPNNKNVILAAEQARAMADREVRVLPTRSMVQGINALMGFNPYLDLEENFERMRAAMENGAYGEVTLAVRDSSVNGFVVKKGEFMALNGDKLVAASPELRTAMEKLLGALAGEDSELVTLYFGSDLKEDEAVQVKEYLEGRFSGLEFEMHYGGQPLYHFLVSVE